MSDIHWAIIVFGSFAAIFSIFKMWNKDTKGAFMWGALVVILAAIFLISGCAVSPERRPYMEVGLGYDFQHAVGDDPQCIVRIRQPIGFGPLEPDWLTIGYQHISSCPDNNDRATVDAIELTAKIPLGLSK